MSPRGPPLLICLLLPILPNRCRHPATGPFTTNTKATSHHQGHVSMAIRRLGEDGFQRGLDQDLRVGYE